MATALKKYHRALDLLLASAAAARSGKHETAGKLLIKASEDPGLDDAIDDVDEMQEEARTVTARRSKVMARRKAVKAADEDMDGEDDSLETLLDDVSEAGEDESDEVSDEELDDLVVEEGSDDEDEDDEEGQEEMVEESASVRRTKVARTAKNMSALARLQATLAAKSKAKTKK